MLFFLQIYSNNWPIIAKKIDGLIFVSGFNLDAWFRDANITSVNTFAEFDDCTFLCDL